MQNKHTKPAAELKAQATDWAKLDAMSDAEIDYSDIPIDNYLKFYAGI